MVNNGSGDYTYDWSFNMGGSSTENGVSSGVHSVTVTDNMGDACIADTTFILIDSDVAGAAEVIIDSIDHITCHGLTNGNVNFTINYEGTFANPAQIIITTDGINSFTNGELGAGEYSILVMDANGCIAGGATFEIIEPEELEVEFSISEGCFDNGMINVIATGGTGNYTYDWLDIPGTSNVEDRTGLSEGVYGVIVSDENACIVVHYELTIMCDDCNGPTIDYTLAFETNCNESTGSAQVQILENPADFNFEWIPSNVGTLSPDGTMLTNVPAGVYQVNISDPLSFACSDSILILVSNEDGPEANINTITPATFGQADGTATLIPSDYIYTWPDMETGDTRTDLAAGTYIVTYTTADDTICYNNLIVEIPQISSLDISVTINQEPDCNTENGNATINVANGSGSYSFYWSDGKTGQNRTDLAAGTYTVIVVDDITGEQEEITFTINNNVPELATITIDSIHHISCLGPNSGEVFYTIDLDPTFAGPETVVISDGQNIVSSNNLSAGDYCISVYDIQNCLVTSECFTIVEIDDIELSILGTYAGCPETGELGALNVTVTGGTAPYTYDWAHINGTNNPEDQMDLAAGLYSITVTDANGCTKSADNISLEVLCNPTCEFFNGMDSLTFDMVNCSDSVLVCAGIPLIEFLTTDFDIYIDGQMSNDQISGCDSDTILNYSYLVLPGAGESGPYYLDSWTVDGQLFQGEFPDIAALVDSMNLWDPEGGWQLNTDIMIIEGGDSNNDYSAMQIYPVMNPLSVVTLGFNIGESTNGIAIVVGGTGEHEIVIVNNETTCSDTLIVVISCIDFDLSDTILLGTTVTFCLDSTMIADLTEGLEGEFQEMNNICEDSSGTYVIFEIPDATLPCIEYTGIGIGTDIACLEICDNLGNCDTITYQVTVIPSGPLTFYDTILINTETNTICFDTITTLAGPIDTVYNFCDDGVNDVLFSIDEDTWCVTYYGLEVGLDSACFAIVDTYGNIDTVYLYVTVVSATTQYICDTIFVGESIEFCLDTTELITPIVSIDNVCWDESGEFVEFFTDEDTWCVTYEGVQELGTDSACIILCDQLGYCDTTYFCITVEEYFDPPIANDDYDTTEIEVPIVINVKANDTVFGGIDTIYIIDGPNVGTTNINLDCTITYDPDDDVCSVTDNFTYVVCNPNGCDTATVYIYIECTDLTIFNGFSPNGDDYNEVFYIDKIEDYPDNYLCVYNRWGNLVYEKKGYNNEWKGTWNNYDLPDGTYFYILRLNNGEEDRTYQGYIQIHR